MTTAPVPVETEARLHLSSDDLAARLRQLPPAPKDAGRVALVVARPEVQERLTPGRCRLTSGAGVENDRWSGKERPDPEAQITVMRADVAHVIGNGQPLFLFGDNLLVELDLARDKDPANTLLSHFNRRRLQAEEIRDAVLQVSGNLNLEMGGAPVVPPLEKEELFGIIGKPEVAWAVTPNSEEHTRRSIYMLHRRTFQNPMFEAFDAPDGVLSCSRRNESTTAPQSGRTHQS